MLKPDYEYHSMMAQTWDLFRGDTSNWDDRLFYLSIIQESGQPVLDLGCGTGRLLLDYLSQGIDIEGLDNSPEMLNLCRQKAEVLGLKPTLYECSMETMSLPRQYQTIIVPSSSFQLIVDPLLAQESMLRLFAHLFPGGILAMPFMILGKRNKQLENPWQLTGEKIRPDDGATIRRWSFSCFDPETQLEHTEDRYEVVKDGIIISSEHHVRSPATREYTQHQAQDLYLRSGFVEINIYKEFTREAASEEDELFVITGKKP